MLEVTWTLMGRPSDTRLLRLGPLIFFFESHRAVKSFLQHLQPTGSASTNHMNVEKTRRSAVTANDGPTDADAELQPSSCALLALIKAEQEQQSYGRLNEAGQGLFQLSLL